MVLSNALLHPALKCIKSFLTDDKQLCSIVNYECRPKQITVEPKKTNYWGKVKSILFFNLSKSNIPNIQVLESSHSIDIIAPGVAKQNLVLACEEAANKVGNLGTVLCIGDRGEWPGNDYQFLSTPYSLSVDTVSPDPESCWNFAHAGYRGAQATLGYLNCMHVSDSELRFIHKKVKKRNL